MDRLGWGIIGIGSIVRERIAPAMVAEPRSELVAAVSRDRGRADAFAREFGARRSYTSYTEMLADPDVDAVFIATPNSLHTPQVVAAAGAGKHILCDKPLAVDTNGALRAVAACTRAEVKLGVNFQYRHLPWVRDVTDTVRSGAIGRVETVQLQVGSGPRDYRNWRRDPAMAGLGSVHNVGVHGLDLLRVILGSEPVEVAAMFDNDPESGSVEWLALILLRFANRTLVEFNCNESVANPRNEISIHGTKGRLVGSGFTRSRVGGDLHTLIDGEESVVHYPAFDAHRRAVAAFTDSILEGKEPDASGQDGLRSAELCAAIRRSVMERRIVPVLYS